MNANARESFRSTSALLDSHFGFVSDFNIRSSHLRVIVSPQTTRTTSRCTSVNRFTVYRTAELATTNDSCFVELLYLPSFSTTLSRTPPVGPFSFHVPWANLINSKPVTRKRQVQCW